jgi:SdiA-regulated
MSRSRLSSKNPEHKGCSIIGEKRAGLTAPQRRIGARRPRRGRAVAACVAAAGAMLGGPAAGVTNAVDTPSTLVNTIHTSLWLPASPDPSGLAYDRPRNRLVITDGEVEEMSIYAGANYFESTLNGTLLRTTNTLRFSKEPTGTAVGPAGKMFITNDDQARIQEIALGENGQFDELDSFRYFGVTQYGNIDIEGIAYDSAADRLFLADGAGSEIYEIRPVDGVFGNGNDNVQHFDTAVFGVNDPESVEFDPATRTLFTVGTAGRKVVQLSTAGALLSTIDISYVGRVAPAAITLAPRSTDPTQRSLYIADRAVDNGFDPTENDGKIYEIAVGLAPPLPPTPLPGGAVVEVKVSASSDDAEEFPSTRVSPADSDLEMVMDGDVRQAVGLRFVGMRIPVGATITNAYIQFVADETQSSATSLTIQGQASDNAGTFSASERGGVTQRPRTGAAAAWAVPPWTAKEAGPAQRTPDLAALVQEVVNRPGWAIGNAMAFVIAGSGHRTAEPFEDPAGRMALLHVEFR